MNEIFMNGAELKIIDDFDWDNIEVARLKPNIDLSSVEFSMIMTPVTRNGFRKFKKWLNGPRKTKKKNFGLARDKRRIFNKIRAGKQITLKDLDRCKLQIK